MEENGMKEKRMEWNGIEENRIEENEEAAIDPERRGRPRPRERLPTGR